MGILFVCIIGIVLLIVPFKYDKLFLKEEIEEIETLKKEVKSLKSLKDNKQVLPNLKVAESSENSEDSKRDQERSNIFYNLIDNIFGHSRSA